VQDIKKPVNKGRRNFMLGAATAPLSIAANSVGVTSPTDVLPPGISALTKNVFRLTYFFDIFLKKTITADTLNRPLSDMEIETILNSNNESGVPNATHYLVNAIWPDSDAQNVDLSHITAANLELANEYIEKNFRFKDDKAVNALDATTYLKNLGCKTFGDAQAVVGKTVVQLIRYLFRHPDKLLGTKVWAGKHVLGEVMAMVENFPKLSPELEGVALELQPGLKELCLYVDNIARLRSSRSRHNKNFKIRPTDFINCSVALTAPPPNAAGLAFLIEPEKPGARFGLSFFRQLGTGTQSVAAGSIKMHGTGRSAIIVSTSDPMLQEYLIHCYAQRTTLRVPCSRPMPA
jgi:hypothetical protein